MRAALAMLLMVVVAGCGGTAGRTAQSPAATVSQTASPAATSSASASPAASPTPAGSPAVALLVIDDFNASQVRLARLDAVDTAAAAGHYDGVVNGQVIVVNGTALEALGRSGSLKRLGTLAAKPSSTGPGIVAVKPDLTQWVYTIADDSWTSRIHLGSATGDRVIATIPSPDGNAFYQAFAWNASGVYFVKEATGLGGVGPFLEYIFPLAKFDIASGQMTDVAPVCYAYAVLGEGTMVCRGTYNDPHLEVRTPSGLTQSMEVGTATGGYGAAFWRVHVSPDNARVAVGRDGAKDPTVSYQMAVAGLTDSSARAFGPLDYVPDTWLPDGRLVADHRCWSADMGGGACNTSLDGTYIFSADGSTRTLFYKLKTGEVVDFI